MKPIEVKLDLRSCPFCGGKAQIEGSYGAFWVRCNKCLVETTVKGTVQSAVNVWNKRHESK